MSNHKKIALITGANKGLGLETARQLGKLGFTVLLGARDLERGQAAEAALKSEGIDAEFVPLEVTDTSSIEKAVKIVAEQYGVLDVLVNNAGWGTFTDATTAESDETWRETFEINVFGLVAVTHAFLPLIKKSEAGRIVNLTSILGSMKLLSDPTSPIGPNAGRGAAYAASKSAVNMYTVNLAAELRNTPIKVNAAHPGWVKTDLGGPQAPMDVVQGARTSVELATLDADGPTGGYFHLGKTLPW